MSDSQITYRINSDDEIIFVNNEWSNFAVANNASELISDKILHLSLWKFITDVTSEQIYRQILRQVRSGLKMQFTIRCDAPETRRLLEMTVSPYGNDKVQFDTRPIWTEERAPQKILQKNLPRKDHIIIICSWCNKIEVGKDDWREVEEAVDALKLFQVETLPQLSHGMCGKCHETISRQLRKGFNAEEK